MSWAKVEEMRDGTYGLRAEAPGISIRESIMFYDRGAALHVAAKIVGEDTEFYRMDYSEPLASARGCWFGEAA